MSVLLHVAVGVVKDNKGRVLISKRPEHVHQGGLWEFPGGKLENDESVEQALQRELHEELGIMAESLRPLIRIPHHYPDKKVLLDVWQVERFSGEPKGMEGQPVEWVSLQEITNYDFPAANQPILDAVRLPERYQITGDYRDTDDFVSRLRGALEQGIRLVQLREKTIQPEHLALLCKAARELCIQYQADLVLNTRVDSPLLTFVDGLHLSSVRLMQLQENPLPAGKWLAASVHNETQLRHALQIGVNFVVASPVMATSSHPGANTIGWSGLQAITESSTCPVYALGGMQDEDRSLAWQHGAQGIAAISAFWKSS